MVKREIGGVSEMWRLAAGVRGAEAAAGVFAAGLLVDAVQNMQELGWLPGGSHQLWHTGSILSEDSALGDIAHSFLGYAQSPTVLQAVVYLAYLACVLFAFFGIRKRIASRVAAR